MNLSRVWTAVVGGLLLVAVGGCAGTVEEEDTYSEQTRLEEELAKRALRQGESIDRIPNYNFSSWNYIDNQHILVTVGVSRQYLIVLRQPCYGLTGSDSVSFATVGSDLTTLDQVIAGQQRCQIEEIQKLEPVPEEE